METRGKKREVGGWIKIRLWTQSKTHIPKAAENHHGDNSVHTVFHLTASDSNPQALAWGNCAFTSCHNAPATASGVVAAASATVTGITFAAKPAGEEVLAKIWDMDVCKGF